MREIKRWVERTRAEDQAHAQRQDQERFEAHFNHPKTIEEDREMEEAQQLRNKAQMAYHESFESALYGEHLTPPLRLTNGQYRRGIRNPEEDMR